MNITINGTPNDSYGRGDYGYYSPFFAGISSGWYEQTDEKNYAPERDELRKVWESSFDEILLKYLSKYGAFFSAWSEDIVKEIKSISGIDIEKTCRYYNYFLTSRIWHHLEYREIWLRSINEYTEKKYRCKICKSEFEFWHTHPDLLREHGLQITICRNCNYVFKRHKKRDPESVHLLPDLMGNLEKLRKCDCCQNEYSLESHIFTYSPMFSLSIDLLYINLYASICPKCFNQAYSDYPKGRKGNRLKALKAYADFLGHTPNSDLVVETYRLKDKSRMKDLIKILQFVRTDFGYKQEHGSYFEALVKAKVFPNGIQKLSRGTRVLAKDGDICLSLKEKDIDDFLYTNHIDHVKEVFYPDSNYRADWEIYLDNRRIFIEYFGLMNDPKYAAKAKAKEKICEENDILLISIFPDSDYESILSSLVDKHKNFI